MYDSPLLNIVDLSVAFGRYADRRKEVVHQVNFQIYPNEKLALVGESGSGKSVTALSILRLHDSQQVTFPSGKIEFQGTNLLNCDEGHLRRIRGKYIGMIFQEPMTSLNPVYPIGVQIIETLLLHEKMSKVEARKRAIELLAQTGIDEPDKRFEVYPHTLSGGQRQRAMIAMALACRPKLLIADEPTTALDVTIQLQILELIESIQKEFNMAVLLITHDLNMVKRFADRICVMQEGHLVEEAKTENLFDNPQHPYTQHLLHSQPDRLAMTYEKTEGQVPLMGAQNLNCHFLNTQGFMFKRTVHKTVAVDNANLQIYSGETVGIVGESGSGKTTLGFCLLKLQDCTGEIQFEGQNLNVLNSKALRGLRRHFQVVFQDPYSSLSPRMTIEEIIEEGLKIHFPRLNCGQRYIRIVKIMEEVGLEEEMLWRYPHEFSGGQRQRIAIARVMVLEPKLVLLDEPTSALDVSVQKQVLELLKNLQKKHDISYLFISHDLKVIRAMSHRIVVMQNGKFVEQGETEALFTNPHHAYTKTLLHASLYTTASAQSG